MTRPTELLSSLIVGSVESVSPNEIRVLLEMDAPHTTALNTGTPTGFPRLNGYVLVPNEAGATVGYISWIGIERSAIPQKSSRDFGLIDLPFPLRRMFVTPVGTLTHYRKQPDGHTRYELKRGVLAFPSVGDQVLIPTAEQVEAIVGSKDADRRVKLGTSPMASNAPIMVDPDKIFGRHLAILGNTGSGKSCTVAGLIRWSMVAAQENISGQGQPNARFIVLDPNGEYAKAFSDRPDLRLFRVPPVAATEKQLDVPAWLWNGHEWTSVAHAQPGAQRPLLLQGIRELKSGTTSAVPREAVVRRYLESFVVRVATMLNTGPSAFTGSPGKRFECARMLEGIFVDLATFAQTVDEPARTALGTASDEIRAIHESRKSGPTYFNDFFVSDLEAAREKLTLLAGTLPEAPQPSSISEDTPEYFDVNLLAEHLERIASEQGGNVAGFISTLGLRIRGMLADQRLGAVINKHPPTTFDSWLNEYVGSSEASNGQIAVIDLSLVPSEVVHILVAVLGRIVFESLQRFRRSRVDGKTLPTVLVLEEAHTFVRRGKEEDGPSVTAAQLCKETFERIAREGRKFGLGLVLSSQRPAELSPTVLAQCNTFLLHRIVNDADQALVAKLVPDNVGGLLRELPSLPSRQAILLGWAAPIPVLVEIDELPEAQRPHSADPDFWAVWTKASERSVDWASVVLQWT
jgi:uncharacterized protein